MNKVVLVGGAALVLGTLVSFGFTRTSSLSANSPSAITVKSTSLTSVDSAISSEDGSETFQLTLAEPWEGAGRRVVVFLASSISPSGFACLGSRRVSDLGCPAEPLTIGGTRFECMAILNVPAWTDVRTRDDVSLVVYPKHD